MPLEISMPNSAAAASTETPPKKGAPPLIRGYTPEGRSPAALTLWINDLSALSPEAQKEAPDMTGHAEVGDRKIPVAAWVHQAGVSKKTKVPYGPFVSIKTNIRQPDGSVLAVPLGVVKAMRNFQGQPVDGTKGLRVIGDLQHPEFLPEKVVISGNFNSRFPDRETLCACAGELGFPDEAVNGFKNSILEAKPATAPAGP